MRRLAARAAELPPRMQDLALALALAAYNVGSLIPEAGQLRLRYAAFALVVLQAIPLTWRRRWPVGVFLAVGLPRTVYDQLGIGFAPLPLASAIAYYTVMDRCSTRVRWAISALLLAGIIRSQLLPGHTEPYDFFVVALQFVTAGTAGMLSRTRRAYLREAEARAEQAELERDRQVAVAAAEERTRIARELHDVVAHHVSLMAVQSQAAAALLPGRPAEAARSVEVIGQTARDALTELRRLLGVLRGPAGPADGRPGTAPAPSVSELADVLGQVRRAGVEVQLRVEGSPGRLAPGVDLTAYRIVQEALTNTVRHSGADRAAVTIRYEPGYVTVSVTDPGTAGGGTSETDGVGGVSAANGADAANGTSAANGADVAGMAGAAGRAGAAGSSGERAFGPGGFGLAGIAERVASCGGSLTVGPGQEGGFAVTARLPAS